MIERGLSRYKARSAELDAAVASKHVHRLLSLRIVKSNSHAPFFCTKGLRNKTVSQEFIDFSSVSLRSANCIVDMRFFVYYPSASSRRETRTFSLKQMFSFFAKHGSAYSQRPR